MAATGKIFSIRGRDGVGDIVLVVAVPHGKRMRQIEVPIRPEAVLAIADAIRCCPYVLKTPRTGETGPGPEAIYMNLRHAVWHLERPERLRPCLPDDATIIEIDSKESQRRITPKDDEEIE